MFLRPLKIMSSFTKDSYLLHYDSILFLSLSFYMFVVSKWSPSTSSASYAFSKSQLYLHIQNDSIFRGTKFGGVCCRFASFFWLYHLLHASLILWEVLFTTLSSILHFFLHLLLPRSIGYSCFFPISSYLVSFLYFLEGANESCYLLAIQSQTMKLELPLTYEIWTPEVIACDDFLICLIWALPFLFHCILAYIFFLSSACDKKSMPVPPGYDRMFIRLWGTGHDLLVISCNFSV